MEAIVALFILLFGLSATGQGTEEEMEMEETPMQMEEMVLEEESMEKL